VRGWHRISGSRPKRTTPHVVQESVLQHGQSADSEPVPLVHKRLAEEHDRISPSSTQHCLRPGSQTKEYTPQPSGRSGNVITAVEQLAGFAGSPSNAAELSCSATCQHFPRPLDGSSLPSPLAKQMQEDGPGIHAMNWSLFPTQLSPASRTLADKFNAATMTRSAQSNRIEQSLPSSLGQDAAPGGVVADSIEVSSQNICPPLSRVPWKPHEECKGLPEHRKLLDILPGSGSRRRLRLDRPLISPSPPLQHMTHRYTSPLTLRRHGHLILEK